MQAWYDPELGSQIGLGKYINNDSLQYAHAWYDPELGSQRGLGKYINNSISQTHSYLRLYFNVCRDKLFLHQIRI